MMTEFKYNQFPKRNIGYGFRNVMTRTTYTPGSGPAVEFAGPFSIDDDYVRIEDDTKHKEEIKKEINEQWKLMSKVEVKSSKMAESMFEKVKEQNEINSVNGEIISRLEKELETRLNDIEEEVLEYTTNHEYRIINLEKKLVEQNKQITKLINVSERLTSMVEQQKEQIEEQRLQIFNLNWRGHPPLNPHHI